MIAELVRFSHRPGIDRAQVVAEARQTLEKWQADPDLLRKHFLVNADNTVGAGFYLWPDRAAAERAHNAAWIAQKEQATGAKVTLEYFDLFLLLDNETGEVREYAEAGSTA